MSVSIHSFQQQDCFLGVNGLYLRTMALLEAVSQCIFRGGTLWYALLSSKPCNFSLLDPFRFGGLGEFFLLLEHGNEMLLSIKCAILLKADMKQASSSRQLRLVNQYFSTDLFMPLISIPVLEI